MDAGDFICRALERETASKVAQARRKTEDTKSWYTSKDIDDLCILTLKC